MEIFKSKKAPFLVGLSVSILILSGYGCLAGPFSNFHPSILDTDTDTNPDTSSSTEPTMPQKSAMSPPLTPETPLASTEPMALTEPNNDLDLNPEIDPQQTTTEYDIIEMDENLDNLGPNDTEINLDIGNPIDEEIYYKYNTSGVKHTKFSTEDEKNDPIDRLWNYAGRSTVIVSIVFVTAVSITVAWTTYRNIMRATLLN